MTLDTGEFATVDGDRPLNELLHEEISHLHHALVSRTVTAQATGLLAGRFDLRLRVAWELLRRLSMESNLKLRDVARVLLAAQDGTLSDEDHQTAALIADCLTRALSAATSSKGPSGIDSDLPASA